MMRLERYGKKKVGRRTGLYAGGKAEIVTGQDSKIK